jgi:hypothetical protein
VPIDAINITLMARAHNMPLEDAQESHIVVVMIIVDPAAIGVIGVGSVIETAA